jgi:AI-2 transport protein TqsA
MGAKVSDILLILVVAALSVVVVAGMQAAAAILNLLLLSVFFATLCAPPLFWLLRRGVPNTLAVLIIMVGFVVAALFLMVFLGRSVNTLSQQLPTYQQRLADLVDFTIFWLNSHGLEIDKSQLPLDDYFNPRFIMSMVTYILTILRVLFTNLFLILLTVLFILLEASGFPRKMQAAFPDPATQAHFKTVTANINRYMGFKTLFSLATGLLIWVQLTLIGVDFAGTWGLLAFLLNFIPAIGSILAAIPAIIWALLQLGFPCALLTLLAYLIVNLAIGNFIEPRLMGRKLGLSTLVVFLSMIFWGWVLGPIGMLLSVPLTMIAKIALASEESTQWIAILLE